MNAVLWCLHSIASDIKLQERMRSAATENPSNFESPIVRACLREVLRLYPVAPFITRILDSDATVGDYTIPKGWLALGSLYSSARDSQNFSEPLKFSPDRWLRDQNQTAFQVINPHATMPFAIGSRSCVGKKIANFQIHCLMTKVMEN